MKDNRDKSSIHIQDCIIYLESTIIEQVWSWTHHFLNKLLTYGFLIIWLSITKKVTVWLKQFRCCKIYLLNNLKT